jgi:urate oxidase
LPLYLSYHWERNPLLEPEPPLGHPTRRRVHFGSTLTHCSPVNLSAFGLDNGLGYEGGAEVFHPVADPSGLITCTVTRK